MRFKPSARASRCPDRVGGGLVLAEPKSRWSRRTIALPAQLVTELKAHRRRQQAERLAAGPRWVGSDLGELVFTRDNGRPLDPRQDWGEWKSILSAAGMRDARLHDARHTAATLLLEEGVPLRVVMEILGHASIHLTSDTYSHVVPELAQ